MSKLIIAEKPSVAKSIASALGASSRANGFYEGNGLIVSWCVGHLVSPLDAGGYDERFKKWRYDDLPILPEPFRYVLAPGKEDAFENLRALMNRSDVDTIVNACDAGREGELIFRLVYEMTGCRKPVLRLWISSMEDSAIREGFSDLRPGADYEALYQSALCRQKADWLVGINATRLFSVLYHRTLNVGRVQTPTLAMLAERDAKITLFHKEKYHLLRLTLTGAEAVSEKFTDPAAAEQAAAMCKGAAVTCTSVTKEQKKEQPPKLYDLTTLQREANRLFGYTAKQTLDYAQSLYEKKLLTYPRTDSRYLTSDMAETASCVIHLAAKLPPFNGCSNFFPLVEAMISEPVMKALRAKFQMDWDGSFQELADTLSQRLAMEACDDFLPDLLDNKRGSFLEELDEDSIASWFTEAASESVHYMILHRCGYAPEQENAVFRRVLDFNTVRTATILGVAVSTFSESVLREIGITVKALNKQQLRTFDSFGDRVYNEARKNETERSQHNETDLHDARRTPEAQPDSPGEPQDKQVRNAAAELPPQASGGDLHHHADGGHPERPSGGGGPGGQPDAGTADNADGPRAGRDGGTESPGSDAMGPADEQHPAGRGGDHLQPADLRLESEQPPFLDERFITAIMENREDDLKVSNEAIRDFFREHHSQSERAAFLKDAYPDRYTERIVDGTRVGYKAMENGLLMWEGAFLSHTKESVFSWGLVAELTSSILDRENNSPVIEANILPGHNAQMSFLDGGYVAPEPEEAQRTFFPQLQLPQQVIDEALCMGFNDRDSRKIICAYFMKDKPDNASFLQESYGTNGAGLIIQGQEYAVWYNPEGIRISTGRTVKKLHTTLVTWEQAAKRIRELLDMGRYMPQAELDQVPDFERRRLAQALAFAVRECSAQAKEAGYLPLTTKIDSSNKGFPEIEAQMQRLLESPDTLKQLEDEWTLFAAAHANDRSLLVSRLYNPAQLLQKLEDLQRTPLIFTAAQSFNPLRRYFISDDEINQALRGHERAFRTRLDVFSFFSQNTDTKEREQFLKRQHGEYSGYHGGNDNKTYTSAGFSFSHGDLTAPYAQLNMKWPAVTKWVSNMISSGTYLYPSDADRMADYEINQLARRIMSFFSNTPDGFQRPTPRSDFDYWEGVSEIQEQLSDPEQVNAIYQTMMQPLMEGTPPDDRFFETRKRGMEAMEGYLAGTFSVFGNDHTLRPLARQAVNEDLEKAKGLITEFCSEEYDSEPDFSDLCKVDIAYTTITDEEVPVQVSVDLVDFRLDRSIDGIIVDSRKYGSLKELTEQELVDPDFDELVAFSEDQLAKVALHGIRNKVVQSFTESGEEIQIQHHVNGFYYNHYNVVDGTARYVDGPYDTLEEAVKEMRGYHPQAVEVVESALDAEEDPFDDIDPQQIRKNLEAVGIVDGKVVDPEALDNSPFIRQVMEDVGAAEPFPTLPTTQRPQSRPHTLHPEISADERRNYHIRTNDLGAGVPIERFYHNVHAIELLHKLESENRLATPNEQDILSQYVGWGGLPQFFEESNAHYAELKALLSEDEYTAARESTLTAFYTSPVVIRAMYKGLSNLGFQTGNILEPSCGVGNFMGLLPENMENSKMYGVELDSISGRIAQQLYQKNSIAVQGFEKTNLPDSFFDVAIGNVPFGQFKVLDKKYDKYNFLIHDYFFARALDKVRPGGVVAFITSNLDANALLSKIVKIILFDDIHTSTAWKLLDSFTEIPVQHENIVRVKEEKSLVDIRLSVGTTKEFYQNRIDSFILASSDSDYWGLIPVLEEAHFLVAVEEEKVGTAIRRKLEDAGITYCYLDDFCTGNSGQIKERALLKEIQDRLEEEVNFNIRDVLNEALAASKIKSCRIE